MGNTAEQANEIFASRFRSFFIALGFIGHYDTGPRRFSIAQALLAALAVVMLFLSGQGMASTAARPHAHADATSRNAVQTKLGRADRSDAKPAVAVGGPFEPADVGSKEALKTADAQFHSLFMAWKKLDGLEQAVISIPSREPVANITRISSTFGVRTDPFNGRASFHPGIDIPGPIGTPIYATADGIVDRAGSAGGYGNLIEINHGRGIQTRYGHLSKILVDENQRVHRGDLIGLMGSTGRSTGSHLHYEVRIDGEPVNPAPYIDNTDYFATAQAQLAQVAQVQDDDPVGGPAD